MRVANVVATASARKRLAILVLAGLLLVLLVVGLAVRVQRRVMADLGARTFQLEVAATEAARERGLSGRPELAADHGMLFVFQPASKDCFWMKDMHFALDMLWLDDGGHIIHLQADATPESYPQRFCPESPARYVLEVPAGTIQGQHLKMGQPVQLRGL